jgi:putative transposase
MSANRAVYPITAMSRLLGVSASGFYASTKRPPSRRRQADAALTAHIRTAHAGSQGTYGVPRIRAELAEQGICVGRKRVARLMRAAALAGISRRRFVTTTVKGGGRQAPDLVDRNFTAERPNVLWVADITYCPTWSGFLYLAVVLDAFSRRIVGWSMAASLHAKIVLDALDMALWRRRPIGVIHHSDQGSQGGLKPSLQHGWRSSAIGPAPFRGEVGGLGQIIRSDGIRPFLFGLHLLVRPRSSFRPGLHLARAAERSGGQGRPAGCRYGLARRFQAAP